MRKLFLVVFLLSALVTRAEEPTIYQQLEDIKSQLDTIQAYSTFLEDLSNIKYAVGTVENTMYTLDNWLQTVPPETVVSALSNLDTQLYTLVDSILSIQSRLNDVSDYLSSVESGVWSINGAFDGWRYGEFADQAATVGNIDKTLQDLLKLSQKTQLTADDLKVAITAALGDADISVSVSNWSEMPSGGATADLSAINQFVNLSKEKLWDTTYSYTYRPYTWQLTDDPKNNPIVEGAEETINGDPIALMARYFSSSSEQRETIIKILYNSFFEGKDSEKEVKDYYTEKADGVGAMRDTLDGAFSVSSFALTDLSVFNKFKLDLDLPSRCPSVITFDFSALSAFGVESTELYFTVYIAPYQKIFELCRNLVIFVFCGVLLLVCLKIASLAYKLFCGVMKFFFEVSRTS